eukprot:g9273.t1
MSYPNSRSSDVSQAASEQVDFAAEILRDTNKRVYGRGSVLPKWERVEDVVSIVNRTKQGLMHKGHLPPTGFWRAQPEDFVRSQEEAAEIAAAEPPSRPPAEHWCPEEDVEEMWRQTEKHVSNKLWKVVAYSDEERSKSEKGHPIAFPVHQHGIVRMCVDFRKKNRRIVAHEKMRLVGVRGAIEIISRLLSPHRSHLALMQYKDDVTADTNLEKADREVLREVLLQRSLTVLGVAYTLDRLGGGITLSITADKVQRLHKMGNTLLAQFRDKSVDFDLLLSFRGLYRHAAQLNLQLAHIVRGLDKWADADNFSGWIKQRKFRQSLRRLIMALLFFQRKQVPRQLAPRLLDLPTAHLYTDASLEDMQGLNEKLRKGEHDAIKDHDAWIGGVIVLPDGRRRAFRIQVCRLPKHVNYCHIGVLEFFALRVATRIFSREMKTHYTVAHIDNLANVYISIRGASTCSVTQNLCASWVEECTSQDMATYSSWVSTIRNVADVLTRAERFEIILKVFPGIVVEQPSLRPFLRDQVWLPTWRSIS